MGRAGGKKGAFQRDAYAKKAAMPSAQLETEKGARSPVTHGPDGRKLSKKQKMKQQQANARHQLKGNQLDKEDKFSSSESEGGNGSESEEEEAKPSFGGGFAALKKGKKK
eukprot:386288_1